MLAIGNRELELLKPLGKTAKCPNCGKMHKVEFGERVYPDGSREPTTSLAFVKCTEQSIYLVGIDGKALR